jgi:hypothetical protein
MKWLVLYIEWGFPVGFIKGNHLVFFHIARENGPLSSMIYLSNILKLPESSSSFAWLNPIKPPCFGDKSL